MYETALVWEQSGWKLKGKLYEQEKHTKSKAATCVDEEAFPNSGIFVAKRVVDLELMMLFVNKSIDIRVMRCAMQPIKQKVLAYNEYDQMRENG
jgi:hypothetical protein